MVDERINQVIADAARSLGENLPVIEIGAGSGSLTKHLINYFSCVHAVERDRDLVPVLRDFFKATLSSKNLFIHEADGARFNIAKVLDNKAGILVGNLPYHLTSSILILTLINYKILSGAVFLVQKEVALRLAAEPNSKDYGFLTAVLCLAFRIELVAYVDKTSFWPVPKIDSAVIKLITRDAGISALNNISDYLFFVRSIFQKRRKKLSTILSHFSRDVFASININADLRPENLAPAEFLKLYNKNIEITGINLCQKDPK
jgi:16S rRNA (adenine1518-N6/adenine1519-N6)-dimethyltransferase